jgi:preprotein translocase subunit SecA/glycosyltransferase involved in cell wall biosynthesis/tetratricopeptide (TPR) repeat protein
MGTQGFVSAANRHRSWMRAVSLAVCFTFLFQEIVGAQGIAGPPSAVPARNGTRVNGGLNLRDFSVPRDIGTTRDVKALGSDEVIINIKDAHDNLGAQESIVELLDNLVTNYDVRTIAVEGTAGYIDTSIISAFPDEKVRKEFADDLMKEGRISAAEYFSIVKDPDVALYGIDDRALHSRNMVAFIDALEGKEADSAKAKALYAALSELEGKIYSPELRKLEENSVLNNNGGLKFTTRWEAIRDIGEKHGIRPDGFKNISNLVNAIALEKKCDFAATNIEREELLNKLKDVLPKNRLEELILRSLSFKLGRISASMFYSSMVDQARLEGMDLSHYPNITTYVDYMTLYESVDVGQIRDEVAEYEELIKERLFRNSEERELSALLKKASILVDLIDVRLTNRTLGYFLADRGNFSAAEFASFIREKYSKYKLVLPGDLDISGVFSAIPPAEEFYKLTLERDSVMVENTIRRMREKGETVAALVTGGFHTAGISELLEKGRISYLVILPKFDSSKKRPYITLITNRRGEYAELVDEYKSHIALESMFGINVLNEDVMKRFVDDLVKIANLGGQAQINQLREFIREFSEKQLKNSNLSDQQKERNIAFLTSVISGIIADIQRSQSDVTGTAITSRLIDVEHKALEIFEQRSMDALKTGQQLDDAGIRREVERIANIMGLNGQTETINFVVAEVMKKVKDDAAAIEAAKDEIERKDEDYALSGDITAIEAKEIVDKASKEGQLFILPERLREVIEGKDGVIGPAGVRYGAPVITVVTSELLRGNLAVRFDGHIAISSELHARINSGDGEALSYLAHEYMAEYCAFNNIENAHELALQVERIVMANIEREAEDRRVREEVDIKTVDEIAKTPEFAKPDEELHEFRISALVERLRNGWRSYLDRKTTAKKVARQIRDEQAAKAENDFIIISSAYNEELTLEESLENARREGYIHKLLIVNDGSTDKTGQILDSYSKYGLTVIHKPNTGKVASIRFALEKLNSDGNLPNYVVTTDADSFFKVKGRAETGMTVVRSLQGAVMNSREKGYAAVGLDILPVVKIREGNLLLQYFQYVKWRAANSVLRPLTSIFGISSVAGAGGVYDSDYLLRAIRKHSGVFSSEDPEMINLIRGMGGKTGIYRKDLVVRTDIPRTAREYLKQYTRYGEAFINQFKSMNKPVLVIAALMAAVIASGHLLFDLSVFLDIGVLFHRRAIVHTLTKMLPLTMLYFSGVTFAIFVPAIVSTWRDKDATFTDKILSTAAAPFYVYFEVLSVFYGVSKGLMSGIGKALYGLFKRGFRGIRRMSHMEMLLSGVETEETIEEASREAVETPTAVSTPVVDDPAIPEKAEVAVATATEQVVPEVRVVRTEAERREVLVTRIRELGESDMDARYVAAAAMSHSSTESLILGEDLRAARVAVTNIRNSLAGKKTVVTVDGENVNIFYVSSAEKNIVAFAAEEDESLPAVTLMLTDSDGSIRRVVFIDEAYRGNMTVLNDVIFAAMDGAAYSEALASIEAGHFLGDVTAESIFADCDITSSIDTEKDGIELMDLLGKALAMSETLRAREETADKIKPSEEALLESPDSKYVRARVLAVAAKEIEMASGDEMSRKELEDAVVKDILAHKFSRDQVIDKDDELTRAIKLFLAFRTKGAVRLKGYATEQDPDGIMAIKVDRDLLNSISRPFVTYPGGGVLVQLSDGRKVIFVTEADMNLLRHEVVEALQPKNAFDAGFRIATEAGASQVATSVEELIHKMSEISQKDEQGWVPVGGIEAMDADAELKKILPEINAQKLLQPGYNDLNEQFERLLSKAEELASRVPEIPADETDPIKLIGKNAETYRRSLGLKATTRERIKRAFGGGKYGEQKAEIEAIYESQIPGWNRKKKEPDGKQIAMAMRRHSLAHQGKVTGQVNEMIGKYEEWVRTEDGQNASESEKLVLEAGLINVDREIRDLRKKISELQALREEYRSYEAEGPEVLKRYVDKTLKGQNDLNGVQDILANIARRESDLSAKEAMGKTIEKQIKNPQSISLRAFVKAESARITGELRTMEKEERVVRATALFTLAFSAQTGFSLRGPQMDNARLLVKNFITNQGTGQGKTFSLGLAMYVSSFENPTTDLLLKDDVTAVRDFTELQGIYDMLSVEAAVITQDMGLDSRPGFYSDSDEDQQRRSRELLEAKQKASRAQIRYVSPSYIFDLQHDLQQTDSEKDKRYFERGYYNLIIDEVDSLFMDQSITEFIMAIQGLPATFGAQLGEETAALISRIMIEKVAVKVIEQRRVSEKKLKESDASKETDSYVLDSNGHSALTPRGKEMATGMITEAIEHLRKLDPAMADAVTKALPTWDKKEWLKKVEIGVSYLLNESASNFIDRESNAIVLIDQATGRDAKGRVWHGGRDQMARALNKMGVNLEGETSSKMTLYDLIQIVYGGNVSGTSGTAQEGVEEFKKRLGLYVAMVPDFEVNPQRILNRVPVGFGGAYEFTLRRMIRAFRDEGARPFVVQRNHPNEALRWAELTRIIVLLAKEKRNGLTENDRKKLASYSHLSKQRLFEEAQGVFNEVSESFEDVAMLAEISFEDISHLTAENEHEEHHMLENAAKNGKITFVTDIAGRATDIKLKDIGDLLDEIKNEIAALTREGNTKGVKSLEKMKGYLVYVESRLDAEKQKGFTEKELDLFMNEISRKEKESSKDNAREKELEEIMEAGRNYSATGERKYFTEFREKFAAYGLAYGFSEGILNKNEHRLLNALIEMTAEYDSLSSELVTQKLRKASEGFGTEGQEALEKAINDFNSSKKDAAAYRELFFSAAISAEGSQAFNGLLARMSGNLGVIVGKNGVALAEAGKVEEDKKAVLEKMAENLIALTHDSPELREKAPEGGFTARAKSERETVLSELNEGFNALGFSEDSALDTALRKRMGNMLLTRYYYGLLYIGQKSPLIRTDRQKQGRPGRAGAPGEYLELIELGDFSDTRQTMESRMIKGLRDDRNFRFREFEDYIRIKTGLAEDRIRALKEKGKLTRGEENELMSLEKSLKELARLRGMDGEALAGEYERQHVIMMGYEDRLEELESVIARIEELSIEIEGMRDKPDMVESLKGLEEEVVSLIGKALDVKAVIATYSGFGGITVGLSNSERALSATERYERAAKICENMAEKVPGSMRDDMKYMAGALAELGVKDRGRALYLYAVDPETLDGLTHNKRRGYISARRKGKASAIIIRNETDLAMDIMNQVFYAAQIALEEEQGRQREDMDKRSIFLFLLRSFGWENIVNQGSTGMPTALAALISDVIDRHTEKIDSAVKTNRSDEWKMSQLDIALKEMSAEVNRDVKEKHKELAAEGFVFDLNADTLLKITGKTVGETTNRDVLEAVISMISRSGPLKEAVKNWQRNVDSKDLNFEQIRHKLPDAIAGNMADGVWKRIENILSGKLEDGEKRSKINKELNTLSVSAAISFNVGLGRSVPVSPGERKYTLTIEDISEIPQGSLTKRTFTKKMLVSYIRKALDDKFDEIMNSEDSELTRELLLATTSLRTAFILEDQELRESGVSNQRYQKELEKRYNKYMKDKKAQIGKIAEWFLRHRKEKYERKMTGEEQKDLDLEAGRRFLQQSADLVKAKYEAELGTESSGIREPFETSPETAALETEKSRAPPVAEKVKGLRAGWDGFIGKIKGYFAILEEEIKQAQKETTRGEKTELTTLYRQKQGLEDAVVVRGASLSSASSVNLKSQPRADDCVPVHLGVRVESDGVIVRKSRDVALEEKKAEAKASEHASRVSATEREVGAIKVKRNLRVENEIQNKAMIFTDERATEGLSGMPGAVEPGKMPASGNMARAVQLMAASGVDADTYSGGVIIDFGPDVPPEKQAEIAGILIARNEEEEKDDKKKRVTVYSVRDAAAQAAAGPEDAVNFDLIGKVSLPVETAKDILSEYSAQTAAAPGMSQENFVAAMEDRFSPASFGIANVYGQRVLFSRRRTNINGRNIETMEISAIPEGVSRRDIAAFSELSLLEKTGGIESLRRYVKERSFGREKDASPVPPEPLKERLMAHSFIGRLVRNEPEVDITLIGGRSGEIKIDDRVLNIEGLASDLGYFGATSEVEVAIAPPTLFDDAIRTARDIYYRRNAFMGFLMLGILGAGRKIDDFWKNKVWLKHLKKVFVREKKPVFDEGIAKFAFHEALGKLGERIKRAEIISRAEIESFYEGLTGESAPDDLPEEINKAVSSSPQDRGMMLYGIAAMLAARALDTRPNETVPEEFSSDKRMETARKAVRALHLARAYGAPLFGVYARLAQLSAVLGETDRETEYAEKAMEEFKKDRALLSDVSAIPLIDDVRSRLAKTYLARGEYRKSLKQIKAIVDDAQKAEAFEEAFDKVKDPSQRENYFTKAWENSTIKKVFSWFTLRRTFGVVLGIATTVYLPATALLLPLAFPFIKSIALYVLINDFIIKPHYEGEFLTKIRSSKIYRMAIQMTVGLKISQELLLKPLGHFFPRLAGIQSIGWMAFLEPVVWVAIGVVAAFMIADITISIAKSRAARALYRGDIRDGGTRARHVRHLLEKAEKSDVKKAVTMALRPRVLAHVRPLSPDEDLVLYIVVYFLLDSEKDPKDKKERVSMSRDILKELVKRAGKDAPSVALLEAALFLAEGKAEEAGKRLDGIDIKEIKTVSGRQDLYYLRAATAIALDKASPGLTIADRKKLHVRAAGSIDEARKESLNAPLNGKPDPGLLAARRSPIDKLASRFQGEREKELSKRITKEDTDPLKDRLLGLRESDFDMHRSRAEKIASLGDIEEAIKEWQRALEIFKGKFESLPDENDVKAKERSGRAAFYAREALERIAELREMLSSGELQSDAASERDNWIADNWHLFNKTQRDEIIKKHEKALGDYTADAEGFHSRARDGLERGILLDGFPPDKAAAAANKILRGIVGEEREAEGQKEILHLRAKAAAARQKYSQNEKLLEITRKKIEVILEHRDSELEREVARPDIKGEPAPGTDDKSRRKFFDDIARLELRIKIIERELSENESELRSAEKALAGLMRKELTDTAVKRGDLDFIRRMLTRVLTDRRAGSEAHKKQAMEIAAELIRFKNEDARRAAFGALADLGYALERIKTTEPDSLPSHRIMRERVQRLKVAILKADLGEEYAETLRRELKKGAITRQNIVFTLSGGEVLEVYAPEILEDAVSGLKGDQELRFLAEVHALNRHNILGIISLRHIVDRLYGDFGLSGRETLSDEDMKIINESPAVKIILRSGLEENVLVKVLDAVKESQGDETQWDKLDSSRKEKTLAETLDMGVRDRRLSRALVDHQLETLNPLYFVALARSSRAASDGDVNAEGHYIAIDHCLEALRLDDSCHEARLFLAELYFEQDRYRSAAELFRKVADARSYGRIKALERLYTVHVIRGEFDKAAKARKELAELRMEEKEYDKALSAIRDAARLEPGSPVFMLIETRILKEMNRTGEALELTGRLVDGVSRRRMARIGTELVKDALGLRAELLYSEYKSSGDGTTLKKALRYGEKAVKRGYESRNMHIMFGEALSVGRMKNTRHKAAEHLKKALETSDKPDMELAKSLFDVWEGLRAYGEIVVLSGQMISKGGLAEGDIKELKRRRVEALAGKTERLIRTGNRKKVLETAKELDAAAKDPLSKETIALASQIFDSAVELCRRSIYGRNVLGWIRTWNLRREKNRDKLLTLVLEYTAALKLRGAPGDADIALKALEGFLARAETREKVSAEAAELLVIKADEVGISEAADIGERQRGLYRRALLLDRNNFSARVRFGLMLAEEGRADEAVKDLETALSMKYGDKDLDLALEAAEKLLEMKSDPSMPRERGLIRGLESSIMTLKERIKASEIISPSVSPAITLPQRDPGEISDSLIEISGGEQPEADDPENIEYLLIGLRAANGFDFLKEKVRNMASDPSRAEKARRAIKTLSSEGIAGLDREEKDALSDLRIIIDETGNREELSAVTRDIAEAFKEKDSLLVELAGILGIEGKIASSLRGKGLLENEIRSKNPSQSENASVRVLWEEVTKTDRGMAQLSQKAGTLARRIITERGNFMTLNDHIKAMVEKGDYRAALLLIDAAREITPSLRPQEARMLDFLKASAYAGMQRPGDAVSVMDGSVPWRSPGEIFSYNDIIAYLEKADIYIRRGEDSDFKEALLIIETVLKRAQVGDVEVRSCDDVIMATIERLVSAALKAGREMGEFENISILLATRGNIMRIADIFLMKGVRDVPLELVELLISSERITSKDRRAILEKIRSMLEDGANPGTGLMEILDIAVTDRQNKALLAFISGLAAYAGAELDSGSGRHTAASLGYKKAERIFASTGAKSPYIDAARVYRGMCITKMKDAGDLTRSEVKLLGRTVASKPGNFDVNMALGKALTVRRDLQGAIISFENALKSSKNEADRHTAQKALASAYRQKIISSRYGRGLKGFRSRSDDIKKLMETDPEERNDSEITGILRSMAAGFNEKWKKDDRALYVAILVELGRGLLSQKDYSGLRSIYQAEYRSLSRNVEYILLLRDAEMMENGDTGDLVAMALHEDACIQDGSVARRHSPLMAMVYKRSADNAVRLDDGIEYLQKAAALDGNNVGVLLALAEKLIDSGRLAEASRVLESLRIIAADKDMSAEDVIGFKNLRDEDQREKAVDIKKAASGIHEAVNALKEAAIIAERNSDIAKEITKKPGKDKTKDLAEETGRMIMSLEALLDLPGDLALIDRPENIAERRSQARDSLERDTVYISQLSDIVMSRALEKGRDLDEDRFYSAVMKVLGDLVVSDNAVAAERLIEMLSPLSKDLNSELSVEFEFRKAETLAALLEKEKDPNERILLFAKARDIYDALKQQKDLKVKYAARLGIVKLHLANGQKLKNVDLSGLDISDLKDPAPAAREIEDMLPEITGLFMSKAAAQINDKERRKAYVTALGFIKAVIMGIDISESAGMSSAVSLLRYARECASKGGEGTESLIDAGFAEKLTRIFDIKPSYSVASDIISIVSRGDGCLEADFLYHISASSDMESGDLMRLVTNTNTIWNEKSRKSKLKAGEVTLPQVDTLIAYTRSYLSHEKKKPGRERDARLIERLEESAAWLSAMKLPDEPALAARPVPVVRHRGMVPGQGLVRMFIVSGFVWFGLSFGVDSAFAISEVLSPVAIEENAALILQEIVSIPSLWMPGLFIAGIVAAAAIIGILSVRITREKTMFSLGEWKMAAPKPIAIGLVGATTAEIFKLKGDYPNVLFIAVDSEETDKKTALNDALPDGTQRAFLLDFGSALPDSVLLDRIVTDAEVRAFVLAQPYLAGLNADNIANLSRNTLVDIFDVIRSYLPAARSMDLEYAVFSAMATEGRREVAEIRDPSGQVITPEKTDEWVDEYVRILGSDGDVEQKQRDLGKMNDVLLNYLGGESPEKVIETLIRHEATAAARYWQSRDYPEAFTGNVLYEIEEALERTDSVGVYAIESAMLENNKTLEYVKDLASKADPARVKIVAFGSNDPKIKDIHFIGDVDKSAVASSVMGHEGFQNIKDRIFAISIALPVGGKDSTTLLSIAGDIEQNAENNPAYVAVERGEDVSDAGQLNIVNLLLTVNTGRPGFMAIGNFEETNELKIIENMLEKIGGLFRRIEKITDALGEMFKAIKAVAVSV